MEHQRRAVSSTIAAILVVVMLIVGFGAAYALKSSFTATVTVTKTVTSSESTCVEQASNGSGAFVTDCHLQITFGLSANPTVVSGSNQTVQLSLTNGMAQARSVNSTGLSSLPNGFNPADMTSLNFLLPAMPDCGLPAGYAPMLVAILNASGSALQLNNTPPDLACGVSTPNNQYSFSASQTIPENFSIGGYWTSSDASEPWLNATYHQFTPGNFTVVAFDPWNQIAQLNFTVTGTGLYNVTFQQMGACSPAVYVQPWSVSLGNQVKAVPSKTILPIPGGEYTAGPEPANLTRIVFSIPDGTYQYVASPEGAFYNYKGNVTVSDSDVTIILNGPVVSCVPGHG